MLTVTLDQTLEMAMQLPPEQQEMLVQILNRRRIEARREQMARDAEESIAAYRRGELKAQSVEEAIRELHKFCGEDE